MTWFIWFTIVYVFMASLVGKAVNREISRDRQLARNIRAVVAAGIPRWLVVTATMLGWPYVGWRLYRGFPEDRNEAAGA